MKGLFRITIAATLFGCSPDAEPPMITAGVGSVRLTPDTATISVGSEVQLYARVQSTAGVMLDRPVTWWSSDPSRANMPDNDGRVVGRAPGRVFIYAYSDPRMDTALIVIRDTTSVAPPPLVEGRALWVLPTEFTSAADVATIMATARSANFNIVFWPTVSAGQALYPSDVEPCAITLCGTLGGTPSWDPMQVAVREAHDTGLRIHAWIGVLRAWPSNVESCGALVASPAGRPDHVLIDHPEWRVVDTAGIAHPCPNSEGGVYLSAAQPGVRARLTRVLNEVLQRYDVDGVHLDELRLPGTAWSYDTVTVTRFRDLYGFAPDYDASTWNYFRRTIIGEIVREASRTTLSAYRGAFISVGVSALYQDRWSWGSQSGYTDYFEDPYDWSVWNAVDGVAPRTFLRLAPERCLYGDWECVMLDHARRIQDYTNRHLFMGVLATVPPQELIDEILLARARGVRGFALHSYGEAAARGLFARLAAGPFSSPAAVPPIVGR